MTDDSLPKRKRRRARRRRSAHAPAEDAGMAVTVVRLGFGAWSLGTEQLTKRLEALTPQPRTKVAAERARRRRRASRAATVGWVAAGVAVESVAAISHWVGLVADGRRGRRLTRLVSRFPGTGVASAVLHGPITRYRASITQLRERGRIETRKGKQMVTLLVRDTTRKSVRDIAESAVKEVAHSPEVAALVRTQSVGMATGTILEVRENSEQADDRLERRVRSWLHIHKPEPLDAGVAAESAPTPKPAG